MDEKRPIQDPVLQFEGGPLSDGTIRPTITVYCETARDTDSLRNLIVATEVEGWEIGREIGPASGALRLMQTRLWRRLDEVEWRKEGPVPSRKIIRAGKIEPHLELVSDMIAEARLLYPDWADLMRDWPLTRIKHARGKAREFGSEDAAKHDGEQDDRWVEHRLVVAAGTPAKRRWRDRENHLQVGLVRAHDAIRKESRVLVGRETVPWAITHERLREIDAADGRSIPGALIAPEIPSDDLRTEPEAPSPDEC